MLSLPLLSEQRMLVFRVKSKPRGALTEPPTAGNSVSLLTEWVTWPRSPSAVAVAPPTRCWETWGVQGFFKRILLKIMFFSKRYKLKKTSWHFFLPIKLRIIKEVKEIVWQYLMCWQCEKNRHFHELLLGIKTLNATVWQRNLAIMYQKLPEGTKF